jgi:type IV secretion system protein VirB11
MSALAAPRASPKRPAGVYLSAYLAPLRPFLSRPDVTDIFVQREGEVWLEAGGKTERHACGAVTAQLIARLAQHIAAANHQAVSRAYPLLSGALPGGERVQVVLASATRGFPALAIRRQVVSDLRLRDYAAAGSFERARDGRQTEPTVIDRCLAQLHSAGDYAFFLREAVVGRKNIIISGGTGSGKTTFLNALLKEIPPAERLIAIEDTPEVVLEHANAVGLVAAKGDQGEARVTVEDLLQASLRMRPDRIMLGEVRGREAYSYLRAVNTGHPGSITTVHADTCSGAIEQMALMVLQAGLTLTRGEIVEYVRGVVDIVVQLGRDMSGRFVSEVLYEPRHR